MASFHFIVILWGNTTSSVSWQWHTLRLTQNLRHGVLHDGEEPGIIVSQTFPDIVDARQMARSAYSESRLNLEPISGCKIYNAFPGPNSCTCQRRNSFSKSHLDILVISLCLLFFENERTLLSLSLSSLCNFGFDFMVIYVSIEPGMPPMPMPRLMGQASGIAPPSSHASIQAGDQFRQREKIHWTANLLVAKHAPTLCLLLCFF